MRFLARLLVIVGLALLSRPWWPAGWQVPPVTDLPTSLAMKGGGAAVALGVLVLFTTRRRRRGGGDAGDGAIRARLAGHGFRIADLTRGWQADGDWRGTRIIVRKVSDAHATRFGRPWTLLVTLPGTPGAGWPFLPEEGGIVERGSGTFTVVVADLAQANRAGELDARLDGLLAARA